MDWVSDRVGWMVAAVPPAFEADPALVAMAIRIAKGVAFAAHPRKFAKAFRDYGIDDLEQDLYVLIREAWMGGGYDPSRGAKPITFMAAIAWRKVEDLRRRMTVRRRHEFGAVQEHDALPDREQAVDEEDLVDLAEQFYRKSQKVLEVHKIDPMQKGKRGTSRAFSLASGLTVFAVRTKLRLSSREMEHLIQSNPRLRAAMHLDRVPSYVQITRWRCAVTDIGISRADKGRVSREAAATASN